MSLSLPHPLRIRVAAKENDEPTRVILFDNHRLEVSAQFTTDEFVQRAKLIHYRARIFVPPEM